MTGCMATASDTVNAIDAAILALVTGKIASYTVGGQTFTYQTLPDLRRIREFYARLAARGSDSGRRVAEV